MNRELVVVMASDNNYSFLLGNALYSLFDTNHSFKEIVVYIIDDKISIENKDKLKQLGIEYGRRLIFLSVPQMPSGIVIKGTLNLSTYYRLAVGSLLPVTINKVLYLDCDILVRGSLAELWNTEINEYVLAGVQDTIGQNSRRFIELKKEDIYVNAGVLLINLARWREMCLEKSCLKYLMSKNYKVEFNDQGIINHCCNGKIKLISPKYNYMIPYDRYTRNQLVKIVQKKNFYTEEELNEARRNPTIVHFAGYAFSRPWFCGAIGRFVEEFLKTSELSGFTFVVKKQPTGVKYKVRRFANSLPDNMAIRMNQLIDDAYRFYTKLRD